ncbi:hypothetical protein Tsubulata_049640, partial [Turnera subulata]
MMTITEALCPHCRKCMETVEHMLLHCPVAHALWQRLVRWRGTVWVVPRSLAEWFPQWLSL